MFIFNFKQKLSYFIFSFRETIDVFYGFYLPSLNELFCGDFKVKESILNEFLRLIDF
jgi:hypothetical protein